MSRPENDAKVVSIEKEKGGMALHEAAWTADESVTRLLLNTGADPLTKDEDGCTPLHVASRLGHTDVARVLIEEMENISLRDDEGFTAMAFAIGSGYKAVIELLLKKDPRAAADVGMGFTALQVAAICGQEAIARLLLQNGSSVIAKDKFGWTALHRAVCKGNVAVAQVLLDNGADIHDTTEELSTALHCAVIGGNEDMVLFLLQKGADIEAKVNRGQTALHLAADYGHEAVLSSLLKEGANIRARDEHDATPLHRAVARGHESVVRRLLEEGADVKARDKGRLTPLLLAAGFESAAVVQMLLDKGSEVDDSEGLNRGTALHTAVIRGNEAIVRVLLENDANPYAKDEYGYIPLDYAIGREDNTITKMLVEAAPIVRQLDEESSSEPTGADQQSVLENPMSWPEVSGSIAGMNNPEGMAHIRLEKLSSTGLLDAPSDNPLDTEQQRHLCKSCASLRLTALTFLPRPLSHPDASREKYDELCKRPFTEFQKEPSCSLCRLIVHAIETSCEAEQITTVKEAFMCTVFLVRFSGYWDHVHRFESFRFLSVKCSLPGQDLAVEYRDT